MAGHDPERHNVTSASAEFDAPVAALRPSSQTMLSTMLNPIKIIPTENGLPRWGQFTCKKIIMYMCMHAACFHCFRPVSLNVSLKSIDKLFVEFKHVCYYMLITGIGVV